MKYFKPPLFFGAVYFLLVGIVHAAGLKIPGLYIYFNVPSYAYQDKVIALLALGWAAFFFNGIRNPSKGSIKLLILIGAVALIMLCVINLTTDFAALSGAVNPNIFHLETGILFLYWIWLAWAYNRSKSHL